MVTECQEVKETSLKLTPSLPVFQFQRTISYSLKNVSTSTFFKSASIFYLPPHRPEMKLK